MRTGEINAHKTYVGKPEEKKPLEKLGIDIKDNIKTDLQ
jgi:hypothetical protein